MKKILKFILIGFCALYSLNSLAQDTIVTKRITLCDGKNTEEEISSILDSININHTNRTSWELGLGVGTVNWSRIALQNTQMNNGVPTYHLLHHHLLGGVSFYLAKSLTQWLYLDIQGFAGLNPKQFDVDNKMTFLGNGSIGFQFRPTPLLKYKFVEPYVRVAANLFYKTFTSNRVGHFTKIEGNEGYWDLLDAWNSNNKFDNTRFLFPISVGVGMNSWLTDRFGIGLELDYMLSLQKKQPNFAYGTARVMWRFGETKSPKPTLLVVDVPREKVVIERVEKIVPVKVADTLIFALIDNIHFDFDKAMYSENSNEILDKVATVIKMYPDDHFLITGFTDVLGSDSYNLSLSTQRAKNVYLGLIKRGVSVKSIKYIGLGAKIGLMSKNMDSKTREGDRMVIIRRVKNLKYWNELK